MLYYYGMKYRGCSIGAQPGGMAGYLDVDKAKHGFYSIIYYDRPLAKKEIDEYELTPLQELEARKCMGESLEEYQKTAKIVPQKHYCIVTHTFSDGYSYSRLHQVDDMGEEYCVPSTPYNQENSESGIFFRDIEEVKDYLLHDFLSPQFETWGLSLQRSEDRTGSVKFRIESTLNGALFYEATTWEGVMNAFEKYVNEDRFRWGRESGYER